MLKFLPFFKLLAFAQVALLARRHIQRLDRGDRRRLLELVRGARHMSAADRTELKGLVRKLEPGAFAGGAVKRLVPVGIPGRRR